MALSLAEKSIYEPLWKALRTHLKRPYVLKAIEELDRKGIKSKDHEINNVVSGQKEDFTILRVLLEIAGVDEQEVLQAVSKAKQIELT